MRKAQVFYDNELAGYLKETSSGYTFQYDSEFFESAYDQAFDYNYLNNLRRRLRLVRKSVASKNVEISPKEPLAVVLTNYVILYASYQQKKESSVYKDLCLLDMCRNVVDNDQYISKLTYKTTHNFRLFPTIDGITEFEIFPRVVDNYID